MEKQEIDPQSIINELLEFKNHALNHVAKVAPKIIDAMDKCSARVSGPIAKLHHQIVSVLASIKDTEGLPDPHDRYGEFAQNIVCQDMTSSIEEME